MKTPDELRRLVTKGAWQKDVVLWVGPDHALQSTLAGIRAEWCDLLDLLDSAPMPDDEDEARAEVIRRLRTRLRERPPGPGNRMVLVVKSAPLLLRYRGAVREFYDWFCGTFGLVVLALDGIPSVVGWPESITCEPDQLPRRFVETGSVVDVFGEDNR